MSEKPYFVAIGAYVEDTRSDRLDICRVPYATGKAEQPGRTYNEARSLAHQIAEALNKCFPNANSGKPE